MESNEEKIGLNEDLNYHKVLLDKAQLGNCRICHDKASGIHYGVVTCEGCKVECFFCHVY